eukprot:CAMPEP_0114572054 /NCGR_PEP_ID=MMETSP0114-20121206/18078_1 /TAXON_ID=31324 /ORGANISM="Goniomonas sp, Strain m" /LENGTH=203 /DNA_ID=CAMNT_0001759221 /DNA_START=78 /DNA_END=686 /DNA_ORIENTATION=-
MAIPLGAAVYTNFLEPKGRLVFDCVAYRTPDSPNESPCYLLDCTASESGSVVRQLAKFKIRSKVQITDVSDQFEVWVVLGTGADNVAKQFNGRMFPDPRNARLGFRGLFPKGETPTFAGGLQQCSEDAYETFRMLQGAFESPIEMPPSTFPLEANLNFYHGVSFTRGSGADCAYSLQRCHSEAISPHHRTALRALIQYRHDAA